MTLKAPVGCLEARRRGVGSPGVPRGRTVLGGRGHPRNDAGAALGGASSGPAGGSPLPVGTRPEAVTRCPARSRNSSRRHVRLHPLVREFSAACDTPGDETASFRHGCAGRVARAFEDFTNLEATGPDGRCRAASTISSRRPSHSPPSRMTKLEGGPTQAAPGLFQRECHHLRGWDSACRPNAFAQQVLFPTRTLGIQSPSPSAGRRTARRACQPFADSPLADPL